MAEEDDDDSFGDFTFASNFNSSQINGPNSTIGITDRGKQNDEDDEWGDFSFFDSNQSQPQLKSASFNGFETDKEKKKTTNWVKPKGPIPLSIFGDPEEEEERPRGNDSQDSNVNNGSKGSGYIGVGGMSYDGIANLFNNTNQKVNLDSNVNVLNLNTNGIDSSEKGSNLVRSGVSLDSGSNILMGLSNQTQKVDVEDGLRWNGTKSLDFDVLKMDFSGWNIGLNSKSDYFDVIGSDSNRIELNRAKSLGSQSNLNGLELDLTQKKSSNFDGWNFGFDGFKPGSNVMNQDFQVSSSNANGDGGDDDDDDDGGWEFKEADSEPKVSPGNKKAESEGGKVLEANTNSKEIVNDSNRSIDLFSMPSGSFDLFSTLNGTSDSSYNIAVGLDSKPSTAAHNGYGLDAYLKKEQSESNGGLNSLVGNADSQEDFGEFAAAFKETAPRKEAKQRLHISAGMNSTSEFTSFSNGSTDFFAGSTRSIDLFAPLNGDPNDLNKVGAIVDTNPSVAPKVEAPHTNYSLDMLSISEKTNDQGELGSHLVVGDAVLDDDFGEFTTASAESAGKPEGTDIRVENHKGPLPLSIFCDEEPEIDGSLDIPNAFLDQSESFKRNNHSSNTSSSINEIISNLYAQAEQVSSVDTVNKQATQNGSSPSEYVLNPSIAQDIDDFDDSSWEFKDASLGSGSENGTSLHNNGNADHGSCSTQLKLKHYVDFYSKLMDTLQLLARCHLESLKEAQTTTTASEDANLSTDISTDIEQILEACKGSSLKNATSKELEDSTGKESDISGLLKKLLEPGLDILESEYSLQAELNLVKEDSRATIKLIKHAKKMSKLLSLGSAEEQLTYVSIWSKMIYVCMEELRYGAQIWKQSLEKNLQSQILADAHGKRFLLSLGEVYRVVVILEASIKLYKPWILLSSIESSSTMYRLLDECHTLWRSSGLEEAILSISVSSSPDGDNNALSLMDSIRHTRDLDEETLENHVFTHQQPLCRLSLLTSSVVPGMAIVECGGMQCFVKLANLWTNLISNDIPKLPSLLVNC